MNALNRLLDGLPRTRFGAGAREVPVFRSCGIAGYYAALIATLGCGLLAGRSLLTLAGVAAVCGLSFFVWAYLRRALAGREEIVLLEHVWFAQLCAAGFLFALSEPLLPYLDPVAIGLCVFLAAGRFGCLLVGCCHGRPSELGIVYGEAACADGFARHLAGVRLFPVQAIEALGLLAIGVACVFALAFGAPGSALALFLIAYSVMRFGLEGLRGDRRPHLLGLSQARWMALAEFAFALVLIEARGAGLALTPRILVPAALLAALVLAALAAHLFGRERRLASAAHRDELRALLQEARARDKLGVEVRRSSLGVSLALSASEEPAQLHLSLCLGRGSADLALLCSLADAIAPRASVAYLGPGPILHLLLPRAARAGGGDGGLRLYGEAARMLQGRRDHMIQPAGLQDLDHSGPEPQLVDAQQLGDGSQSVEVRSFDVRKARPVLAAEEVRESYFAPRDG